MASGAVPIRPVENAGDSGTPSAIQDAGSVNKIRDILFGAQLRDYERRFARMEETLAAGLAETREDTGKRLESLESFIRSEIRNLTESLRWERQEREAALTAAEAHFQSAAAATQKRMSGIEGQSSENRRELHEKIHETSASLQNELTARSREITALIERRFLELNHAKTDRAALASFLAEVAVRLSGDVELPGAPPPGNE